MKLSSGPCQDLDVHYLHFFCSSPHHCNWFSLHLCSESVDIIIISFFELHLAKSKLKVVHNKNIHVRDAIFFSHMTLHAFLWCKQSKTPYSNRFVRRPSVCQGFLFLEPHAFPRTLVFSISINHSFGLAHLVHDIFLTITIFFADETLLTMVPSRKSLLSIF